MTPFILLRLEAPLQGWGDVARDSRRPAGAAPGRSALTGLLANALGWRYEDGDRTNALQAALRVAIYLHTPGVRSHVVDFQTAYLRDDAAGWTRRGVEGRRGDYSEGNTILRKEFMARSEFGVAVGLRPDAPVSATELQDALARPARTLFLGRRSCLPTRPILDGMVQAPTATEALLTRIVGRVPVWYDENEGPLDIHASAPDQRNFTTDRFSVGARVHRSMLEGERL